MDSQQLKEEGNKHFKAGEYEEALSCYTKALQFADTTSDKSVFYKNRSACHLKLGNAGDAASDASSALETSPNDTKSLFRRSQALEMLGKHEESYKDAMKLLQLEPKNKAIVPILQRLSAILQEKSKQINSTDNKMTQMFELAFDDVSGDKTKRQQALSNILVLSREESGAQKIFAQEGIQKLSTILETKDETLLLNALRILSCLSNHSQTRAYSVIKLVGLPRILGQFGHTNDEVCNACSLLVQALINGISNIEKFREELAKHEEEKRKTDSVRGRKFRPLELNDEEQEQIDAIFASLAKSINSKRLSAHGRDCVLELLIRNLSSSDGLNWTRRFLEADGAARIMEVAGMMPARATIAVGANTRMHCSVLLDKIWGDTTSDQQRDKIKNMCQEYFVEQFGDESFDSKLDAIVALSCLLQGPLELGNMVLGKPGITDMLLALADSKEVEHQLIAVEALVHATSKKDKCIGMVKTAIPIMKHLYKTSSNDNIRVRALVGMCKISSSSGTDASDKALSDDSILALSRACRKFLGNTAKDVDLRKWAVEGLAYLTLDAEVKEELVSDPESLTALVEIAKVGDQTVLFPAASILVNLMNAYAKPEILPEMKQLAEYSKQKVPEEHTKDKEHYVEKRIETLVSYNAASAAVALCQTESEQCKELLSRIFLALVTDPKHRGKVVAQGGGKVLIPLAIKNTYEGQGIASQALAKIAITINPETAFPGQRVLEVVRPLVRLLHPDRDGLQNFEALMALTNIASASPSARRRIVSEKGVGSIEAFMFEDHDMLRRAATECMCNMVQDEEVSKVCLAENDRVKMFTLFCGDEEPEIQRAACGALAILSADYPKEISDKVAAIASWQDLMLQVLVSELHDIQHRATYLMSNLLEVNESMAEQVVNGQLFEVLMAISKLPGPEHGKAKECAEAALKAISGYGLAKPV